MRSAKRSRSSPDYAFGHATLGLLERDLGDDAAAGSFAPHGNAGCGPICAARSSDLRACCSARSRLDESAQLYMRAIKLAPGGERMVSTWGSVLAERGRTGAGARRVRACARGRIRRIFAPRSDSI
jgi:hypothetical protein